eukprot:1711059-Rhodomonas_salina.2
MIIGPRSSQGRIQVSVSWKKLQGGRTKATYWNHSQYQQVCNCYQHQQGLVLELLSVSARPSGHLHQLGPRGESGNEGWGTGPADCAGISSTRSHSPHSPVASRGGCQSLLPLLSPAVHLEQTCESRAAPCSSSLDAGPLSPARAGMQAAREISVWLREGVVVWMPDRDGGRRVKCVPACACVVRRLGSVPCSNRPSSPLAHRALTRARTHTHTHTHTHTPEKATHSPEPGWLSIRHALPTCCCSLHSARCA